jgi:hypothetical protein
VAGPSQPVENTTNMKYVFIGVVLVVLAGLLIGVLVAAQRKREHGVTWFPEGFFRNNRLVCMCSLNSFGVQASIRISFIIGFQKVSLILSLLTLGIVYVLLSHVLRNCIFFLRNKVTGKWMNCMILFGQLNEEE